MWGSQTVGLQPDLLTCAKALSSAYQPISAVMVCERVFEGLLVQSDRLGLFGHGFTYSGHPVPAAVALEALRIVEERGLVAHAHEMGERLQRGLRRLAADSPIVGEARGVGLMGALELVRDRATRAPFDASRSAGTVLARRVLEQDLIVRPLGDAVVMAPPLIITAAEVDELLRRLGEGLRAATPELLSHA
jgi:4-aminobutyrate--pyruvate transaminase